MNRYDFDSDYAVGRFGAAETVSTYTAKTFLWMFAGLLLTFGIAFGGYATSLVLYVFSVPYMPVLLLLAEVGVVLFLSARIQKLSVNTARVLFFVYAALNGVVFSVYFLLFDVAAMILTFGATALYFGALAAYGYFTKTDLSRLRPILLGGLFFLILFGFLSIFLPLETFERVYCLIGIAVFLGFTAYDTQKIKAYYEFYAADAAMAQKASIFAALQLYLDFINLFLYLLRFFGGKGRRR